MREGHELDTNHRSMTSPPTLASSPSDFKASSCLDMRHLRRQAPQEKLPKLKSATSTSYYDFDIDFEIPFYGTQHPEEYLEWERKMDTYLKLLQVPSEDQVKCATRNFHDYASTWWLHTPSKSFETSWSKTKKSMRQEFVPSTYTEHLQRHLGNTIQGSKPLDEYFMEMKKALRRAGVADPIWMKFHFMMGLNNDIAKTIFTNTYKSLDDLYFGALKAKATRPREHFATIKLNDHEHEDGSTKMSKPDELQDGAPKSDFTAIPLCGIDYAESSTTLFEDGAATTTTMEPIKEHAVEESDRWRARTWEARMMMCHLRPSSTATVTT